MMYFYLYKTTNLITNKFYVGVHSTSNLEDGYLGSGTYLKRSLKKYGKDNFSKEIIKFFDTKEEMYKAESDFVKEAELNISISYNLKAGGQGGFDYINRNRLSGFCKVDIARKGREIADKILLEKHGPNFRKKIASTLGKIVGGNHAINKTGICNPEVQKLAVEAALSESAKLKRKETQKRIGFQQKENNSQFGKCWITKDTENKSIKKEELANFISLGWKKGRYINATRTNS